MNYKQLSEYEHAFIDVYLQVNKPIRSIAKELSRCPSTISREIRRLKILNVKVLKLMKS